MSEYFSYVLRGTDILFGNSPINTARKKTLDVKKELKIAKAIKKTSPLARSSQRVKKIVDRALS